MEDRLGRYRLLQKLATGGMAEVFLATAEGPQGFEKTVVIKRVLPHFAEDPQFTGMFLDEARLAAKLEHPNVVQIFDLGEVGGQYFIAMEYVRGHSLSKVIRTLRREGRTMPHAMSAYVIARVAAALHYAHSLCDAAGRPLGLVHRDVSPDNVLVSNSGVVKLIDFGIAKAVTNEHRTQSGSIKGKFAYMSPEQVRGQPLDGRSDVFAAGVCLYELTTRTRPFSGPSEMMTVAAVMNDPPPPPRAADPDYPADLEAICLKCLEKDREARYRTAREMEEALDRFALAGGTRVGERDVAEFVSGLLGAASDGSPGPSTEPLAGDSGAVKGGRESGGVRIGPEPTSAGVAGAGSPVLSPGSRSVPEPEPKPVPASVPEPVPASPAPSSSPTHPRTAIAGPTPGASPVEGRGSTLGLLIVACAVLLAAIAAGGWFLLRPRPESLSPQADPPPVAAAQVPDVPSPPPAAAPAPGPAVAVAAPDPGPTPAPDVPAAAAIPDVAAVAKAAGVPAVAGAADVAVTKDAAAPPAVRKPVTGMLSFVAPAGVTVRLDHRDIGRAPIAPRRVREGTHRVEFRNDKGYVIVRIVTITESAQNVTARW
ncbi:MAG: serine/threonine protein kinase [Deltaproteobacteria bacterium]|nr:serine/threonine protein kinase [Deltaproteobacteria bacterium]